MLLPTNFCPKGSIHNGYTEKSWESHSLSLILSHSFSFYLSHSLRRWFVFRPFDVIRTFVHSLLVFLRYERKIRKYIQETELSLSLSFDYFSSKIKVNSGFTYLLFVVDIKYHIHSPATTTLCLHNYATVFCNIK